MIDDNTRTTIISLHQRGRSRRFISLTLNHSRNTVAKVIREYEEGISERRKRKAWYDALDTDLIIQKYKKFDLNAVTLFRHMQDHPSYYGMVSCDITLRTLQKFVRANYKVEQIGFAKGSPNAFHCTPGQQIQIDFTKAMFEFEDGEREVFIFEVVYSHSRFLRCYVCRDMSQLSWLSSICRCVLEYGVPREILCDNDKSLVTYNNGDTYLVNPTFAFFCEQLGTTAKPCKPFRPQTKGRVERAGGYIKRSALGYLKGSETVVKNLEELQKHLDYWCETVADAREHNGKTVLERYQAEREFLYFPDIDPESLKLQVERFIVNASGQITFFGYTCQIEEERFRRQPVIVAILPAGKFIVSTEGGATICKGQIPAANMLEYPFKEDSYRKTNASKPKPRPKKANSSSTKPIRYGQRSKSTNVTSQVRPAINTTSSDPDKNSISWIDEMMEGAL